MKNILLIFSPILLLVSCGYPDIDSVPNFENLIMSEQEAIDLCKLTNADRIDLMKCLVSYYEDLDIK